MGTKYKYINPTEKGFTRIKMSKKDIKKIFKRYSWKCSYEIYENEYLYLRHEFVKWYLKIIIIALYPISVLIYGLSNIKEINNDMYEMIFQKKTGDFISDSVYKNKTKKDNIDKTLDLIR